MAEKPPKLSNFEKKYPKQQRSTSVFGLMEKEEEVLKRSRSMSVSSQSQEPRTLSDEINTIRSYIKCKFQFLKGKINQLEDKMLDSLEEIERKYSEKQKKRVAAIGKINLLKNQIDDLMKENSLRINATIDDKYMATSKKSEVCISLHWPENIESSFHQIEEALKITEHDATLSLLPHEGLIKIPSTYSFGKLGQGLGEMVSPRCITISRDGNVYCSDWENNTILSFSQFGEYIHAIKDVKHPYGVYAHSDRLFVTEANNSFLKVGKVGNHACVKSFDLNGNLLKKLGKWGSSPGHFKSPSGITSCEFEDTRDQVFVCDTDNNRLQILSVELEFIKVFVPGKVKQPDDVKVQEGHVYILDKGDPCLHIFTFQEEPIAHIITRGPGRDIESSFFFTLDKCGSIVMGDHDRHCLRVFTPSGKLARSIGKPDLKSSDFCHPLGIAYNQDDMMAVVSLRQTGCIRLFNLNLSVFSF